MEKKISITDQIKNASLTGKAFETKFNLKYNPFPKVGIANLGESEDNTLKLEPAYEEITDKIVEYMKDAITHPNGENPDNYLSLVIRGEYGSGKTQTLMYIKSLFLSLKSEDFNPYIVYIDNPGMKLSEMIGSIISQVGIENFRRYLWDGFIEYLETEDKDAMRANDVTKTHKDILLKKLSNIHNVNMEEDLFTNTDESSDEMWRKFSNISYKYLLEKLFKNYKKNNEQKEAVNLFKEYLTSYFLEKYCDAPIISDYFYDVVTENINVSKSWSSVTSGNIKNIDKKEVLLLKTVVDIAKIYLNATDFIILIDEFEEIAVGRLKTVELDNYLRNLRMLIDKEKNWCSVFAMNNAAYEKIRQVSPPLASRIGDRIIDLKPFDLEALKKTVVHYLDMARTDDKDKGSLSPFTEEALKSLLDVSEITLKGSPRYLLKKCFTLLQRAAEELDNNMIIDSDFVNEKI